MSDSCCAPAHCAAFLNHAETYKSKKYLSSGHSDSAVLMDAGNKLPGESALLSKRLGEEVEILAAAGVQLPAMYSTRFRRWLGLLVFSLVSACASGPMMMWPTLEPILIQERVFQGPSQLAQLSEVYALTMGIVVMSSLPVGVVYDSYGPRCLAVIGSLVFSVFAICMGLSIRYQSLNWMLYYAYPIAILFGFGQNYGAYGFQWLLPESQNTVNSIIMATQALSDSLVLVCVWLHNAYDMALWTYFYWLAVFAVATAILCNFIVPSRREHFKYAGSVIAYMKSLEASGLHSTGYGSTGRDNASSLDTETGGTSTGGAGAGAGGGCTFRTSGWRWWDNVKGTCTIACNYPVEHLLFVSGCCSLYMFTWYPTVQMYPFYFAMFGKGGATYLVNAFAVVYGLFGALAVVVAGRIMDWLGMKRAILLNNVLVLSIWISIMVPTVKSQLICQVFMTLSASLFGLFAFRFCMLYAPPEIFGTYTGMLMTLMGVFQITLSSITDYMMVHIQGYEVFLVRVMVSCFGVVTFVTWTGLVWWWEGHPLPEPGSVTRYKAGLPEESEYAAAEGADDAEGWF